MATVKNIINKDYFEREQYIPSKDSPAVAQEIADYISQYEPIFLQKAMGYSFYATFYAAINVESENDVPQRFKDIIYGADFTVNGVPSRWFGLKQPELKKSLIAQYVYTRIMRQKMTETAGFGEVSINSENAKQASPLPKMVTQWNLVIDGVETLQKFLRYKVDEDGAKVYPEFAIGHVDKKHLRKKNIFQL